jgi:hypothetical protein
MLRSFVKAELIDREAMLASCGMMKADNATLEGQLAFVERAINDTEFDIGRMRKRKKRSVYF